MLHSSVPHARRSVRHTLQLILLQRAPASRAASSSRIPKAHLKPFSQQSTFASPPSHLAKARTYDPTLQEIQLELDKYLANPGIADYILSPDIVVWGDEEGLDVVPDRLFGVPIVKHLVSEFPPRRRPSSPQELPDMALQAIGSMEGVYSVSYDRTSVLIRCNGDVCPYLQRSYLGIPLKVEQCASCPLASISERPPPEESTPSESDKLLAYLNIIQEHIRSPPRTSRQRQREEAEEEQRPVARTSKIPMWRRLVALMAS